MNKRIISSVASILSAVLFMTACGGSNDDTGTTDDLSNDNTVKVGLVTDEGGLNDKSFNQSANEGLERAVVDLGVTYSALESQKKDDFQANIQALVDDGSDLTFASGYQLTDALSNVAEENPDNHFCIIDAVVERPNVVSITFKEEEGSFLVGVIAGLTTKTNKVGFIGGKDTETIEKFECGFAAGVKAVNPEAAEGLISTDGKSSGTTVKYADSFADTNKGYELAKSLYEAGCDVIYHASGGVGIGMFQAAQELKDSGKEVWAIGVDMDQSKTLPEYSDVLLTSMVKNVDRISFDTVQQYLDGTIKYEHESLGLKEGGVSIADTTSNNASPEAIAKCEEYAEKIESGEIVVPSTRQGVIDFK